ncbi:hypothetical protein DLM76_18635 [Leptospira yasudae]|uniref:HisA/HisF-related TIM barrel protein n=1 Tax=Leptospira yasudae TaxID=2202201 RepID=UPI000E5A0809|nr:HisA/HisF-related TIM barrel protein [Leptospira yasudae]RHX91180.1 hypothetical protein DLM76_18635 [Leptospira yasudae]
MGFKKRIIGMIVVLGDQAVQSFGYRRYLPLGKPSVLAENLDRWGADEIIVLSIDRFRSNLGPNIKILQSIAEVVSTPIAYGGGIRNLEDALSAIHAGADRLVLDQIFHFNQDEISKIAEVVGSQAVILSLPVVLRENTLFHLDYLSGKLEILNPETDTFLKRKSVSEIFLVDYENEGKRNSFNESLLEYFKEIQSVIAFGGISEPDQMSRILGKSQVSAVACGNFLNYREHSIQNFKQDLGNLVRKPVYKPYSS